MPMKILVILERSPKYRFLVKLKDEKLARDIKRLVDRKKYSTAMVKAVYFGSFEKEILAEELPFTGADLILSEKSAHWDLLK